MSWFFGAGRASRKSDGTPLLSGKACVFSIVVGIVSLSGCDRTRTTSQSITIAVEDGRGLPVPDASVKIKESFESRQTWGPGGFKGFDVRLMSSAKDVNSIPTASTSLIVVANVQDVLHFRIFDFPGNRVVDTDENQLPDKAPQIAQLKLLLTNLWGIPRLSQKDKDRVTNAVTSIVDQSQIKEALEATRAFWHEQWESDPWYEGSTNALGKAVLKLVVEALDWTKGSEPPAFRDWVSNREYLVRLQTQNAQDELRVVMKPGTASEGKRYTVRIEAVQKPVYLD